MKKSQTSVVVSITHQMSNGDLQKFQITTDNACTFKSFVSNLNSHIKQRSNELGERQYFRNNTQILSDDPRTIDDLGITDLLIKNKTLEKQKSIFKKQKIYNWNQYREKLYETRQFYKTKLRPSSLNENLDLQNEIKRLDKETADIILTYPEFTLAINDQQLKEQSFFNMKRHFEEVIQEGQHQILPQNEEIQNILLNVLSDQLKLGNKKLIVLKEQGQIQSLQVASASYGQNICQIKFSIDQQNFSKEEQLLQELKRKISKTLNIEEQNIDILGLEKGSRIVNFIANGQQLNEKDYATILEQYEPGQISFTIKPFFEFIGLSHTNFNHLGNQDWIDIHLRQAILTQRKQKYQGQNNFSIDDKKLTTGPSDNRLYSWNPIGWKAYGLNVINIYNDNRWLEEFGEGAWYVVYALPCDSDSKKVQDRVRIEQVLPNNVKSQTKVFNKIEIAERNCKITKMGENQYKMILQGRVYPQGLFVNQERYNFNQHSTFNEFYFEDIQHFRVERILLKNMSGGCAKFTDCVKQCQLI